MESAKPKLAMYWGASCGGCEVSLVNTHEALLEIDQYFDFIFCPCLLDGKKADLEALDDGAILLTLLNGALRTEENLEMARLLRRKSRLVVAFGSCAASGGIPALGNHHGTAQLLTTVFSDAPGLDECVPEPAAAELPAPLPAMLPRVYALHEKITVDATLPGCPPEPEQIVAVMRQLMATGGVADGQALLGCGSRSLCDECSREKRGILAPRMVRSFEIIPEHGWCLLEQGIACVGSATRGGCGALCPAANMPCSGCYGVLDETSDPGAAALTALAAALQPVKTVGISEAVMGAEVCANLAAVADPLGTLYRYNLAESVLADRKAEGKP